MTTYLVDTSVLIDASRGRIWALRALRDLARRGDRLGTCAICVGEFHAGAPIGTHPAVDALINSLDYWDISAEVAARAGQLSLEAKMRGRQVLLADALIGALAMSREAVVLSDNVRDFEALGARVLSPREEYPSDTHLQMVA